MEIQDIKRRLSITDVAQRLGIKADRYGRALCPFHDDKNPSLQISREKNIATCFSSRCDAGTMDIIGLTEKYLKLTTHETLLKLSEWAGVTQVPSFTEPVSVNEPVYPKDPEALERIAILTKAFFYFENGIKNSPQAKAYLESRGLTQQTPTKEGIEVGFNSGNFHKNTNRNLVAAALKYGIIYPGRSSDRYLSFAKDSLVFALRNRDNKITGLYFRSIDEKAENRHYYLKDRRGLYPRYPKEDTVKLILTEAVIDAATLQQLKNEGIKELKDAEILASYGVNGLTSEHLEAIKDLKSLKEIIFFFDGDKAGTEGVKRMSEDLHRLFPGVRITSVNTPENEDINSLYTAHPEKAPELFKRLLNERKEVHFTVDTSSTTEPFSFSAETHDSSTGNMKDVVTGVAGGPGNNNLSTENPSSEKKKLPAPQKTSAASLDASNPERISYVTQTALYEVKGGVREEGDRLQVSLMIEALGKTSGYNRYRNRVDLYENKQVERLAREAAEKLSLRSDLLELDLHRLTDLLEEYRERQSAYNPPDTPVIMPTGPQASRCRGFLEKPGLIGRFNGLIEQSGVVGEMNNRIFLFCIAASYRMADTLHGLIQGTSGSGKTHLLAMISNLMPPEDVKRFTRVTESSFYNYGTYDLRHKLICLEDLDGMKEEAQLALRELQSRGMLTSSTTGQDEKGNSRSFEKTVHGPVATIACTTRGEIYEDNMSRCFLIAVDETSEQTARIIDYQNLKASGRIDRAEESRTAAFIQDCIRMLRPYQVVNPYAGRVQLPPEAHKIRRLNDLYQSFVRQVTLMNQYRRVKDDRGRLVTQKEDLQTAADIMFESIVLKVDELDGSLRHFYEELKGYVKAKGGDHYETYSFGQREVRHSLNISKSQLQRYISDLVNLEYIQFTGGHVNRGFYYRIIYWDNVASLRGRVKRHLQGQLDQLELL